MPKSGRIIEKKEVLEFTEEGEKVILTISVNETNLVKYNIKSPSFSISFDNSDLERSLQKEKKSMMKKVIEMQIIFKVLEEIKKYKNGN